jgi:hypothetical protein
MYSSESMSLQPTGGLFLGNQIFAAQYRSVPARTQDGQPRDWIQNDLRLSPRPSQGRQNNGPGLDIGIEWITGLNPQSAAKGVR